MVINDSVQPTIDEHGKVLEWRWRIATGAPYFDENLIRIESEDPDKPFAVADAPFDRANPDHVGSIPPGVKAAVLVDLFRKAKSLAELTEEEVGNSAGPGAPSTTS
jgi:hypothetical protein